MTPDIEARIVIRLRSLLNSNGLGGVKIVGYEVILAFPTSFIRIDQGNTAA